MRLYEVGSTRWRSGSHYIERKQFSGWTTSCGDDGFYSVSGSLSPPLLQEG